MVRNGLYPLCTMIRLPACFLYIYIENDNNTVPNEKNVHSFKNRYARRPCFAKLAGSAAHDEPLLTPHAHFGLVVAMG